MALRFDFTAVSDETSWKDENDHMTGMAEGMVWATMFVGIGEISDKTLAEFQDRLSLYQTLHGALLVSSDGPVKITAEDVAAYRGLRTNVGYETRTKWIKRQVTQSYFTKPEPKF